jgi:hypothetical protein
MDTLYVIKAGDAIKIGITSNFNSRIKSIQTGNPNKIIVLKTYYEDRKNIEYLERKLHFINNDIRLNGEWFKFYDNIENDIHKIILSEYPKIEFKIHDINENFIPKKLNFQIPKPFETFKNEIIVKPIVKKLHYHRKLGYDIYRYNKSYNYWDVADEFHKSFLIRKSIKNKKHFKPSFFERIMAKYKMTNYKKAILQNQKPDIGDTKNRNLFFSIYKINYKNIEPSETKKAAPKDCPNY